MNLIKLVCLPVEMLWGIVLFRVDTVVTLVAQVRVLKFYPAIRGVVSIASSSQTFA